MRGRAWGVVAVALLPPTLVAVWEWPERERRVGKVAFSADGATLATLSFGRNSQARLYDVATGREQRAERQSSPWEVMPASADGQHLLPMQGGPTLEELGRWPWSALIRRFANDDGQFSISPDGRVLAQANYLAEDGGGVQEVVLWELPSGRRLGVITPGEETRDLAFSNDGRVLAVAGGHLTLWDVDRRAPLDGPRLAGYLGRPVAFDPSGRRIAAHGPGAFQVLDTATGEVVGKFPAKLAHAVAFSPDGRRLVGVENRTATVWDVATGAEISRFDRHNHLGGLAIARIRLARATGWDALEPDSNVVWTVAVAPDGRTVASGDHHGRVWLWDLATGRPIRSIDLTRERLPRAVTVAAWAWSLAWLVGMIWQWSRRSTPTLAGSAAAR